VAPAVKGSRLYRSTVVSLGLEVGSEGFECGHAFDGEVGPMHKEAAPWMVQEGGASNSPTYSPTNVNTACIYAAARG